MRWLPWAPRWRGPQRKREAGETRWSDWLDIGEPFAWFDDGLGGFVTAIVLLVLLVIAALFILPVFVFIVELVIVALVVAVGIALRVVFRRPWLVDAYVVENPPTHFTWKVVGVARAKDAVDLVAQQLAAGVQVPQVPGAQVARQPSAT
ncbi:MAG: hypothetical protein M3N53_06360 [Actinomycetota bacterium]|nr:hypothetical protein [Actinomycetota bacterium]